MVDRSGMGKVQECLQYNNPMMIIVVLWLLVFSVAGQDAMLTPADPFRLTIHQPPTYHQTFLIEIEPHQFNAEWALLYAHMAALTHSIVELDFIVVLKQYPEREGRNLAKCRLDDSSKRWCRVDAQGLNIQSQLIKVKLDCVSDCNGNITIGFARSSWTGQEVPPVMGAPLEQPQSTSAGNDSTVGLRIIGWMVLTLVLVLLAIQFAEKVATKFDAKMQQDRMKGLKEQRIPQKTAEKHRKAE